MRRLIALANHVLPALLMASSVTLLAAGLLSYGSPDVAGGAPGGVAVGSPVPGVSFPIDDGADPGDLPSPEPTVLEPSPPPTPSPAIESPIASVAPSASSSPAPGSPSPSIEPTATPEPAPVSTRIVIPSLEIDLPIVSRRLHIPNQGPDQYPPCDVAVYHTAYFQPSEAGTTYIYAHARDGMFLPILDASLRNDGAALIGDLVQVYTDDNREYVYQITKVKRHAIDFSLADNVAPGVSQLVLQTSEGPRGTIPKLQVLAQPIEILEVSAEAAHPKPRPRACYDTP